jgi:hypothetical protein
MVNLVGVLTAGVLTSKQLDVLKWFVAQYFDSLASTGFLQYFNEEHYGSYHLHKHELNLHVEKFGPMCIVVRPGILQRRWASRNGIP